MKTYLHQCQKEYFYIIDKLAFMSLAQEECNCNEHHLRHVLNKSKEFSTHYLDCIDYVFSCKNTRTEKKSLTDYPRKLLEEFWPVQVAYSQFYELYFAFCLLLFLNPKHSNAIEDKLIDCRESLKFIHKKIKEFCNKKDSFMITKMASEDFINYIEFGYGIKIIQRSKKKFSKTSSSCQAIADIEKHILITKDTEKRKSQLSFTHLIGSFCRIFDMSVVVYVEETVLNQKNIQHTSLNQNMSKV